MGAAEILIFFHNKFCKLNFLIIILHLESKPRKRYNKTRILIFMKEFFRRQMPVAPNHLNVNILNGGGYSICCEFHNFGNIQYTEETPFGRAASSVRPNLYTPILIGKQS